MVTCYLIWILTCKYVKVNIPSCVLFKKGFVLTFLWKSAGFFPTLISSDFSFVKRISVESFNVELASQVIKTLRRSIYRYVFTTQTCSNPDDMFDSEGNVTICETWREVYRNIVSGLQDAIAAQYGNTMLYLPSI